MQKESQFERKFLNRIRRLKNVYVPPKTSPGSIHGIPDRFCCVNGRFVSLEFKRSLKDALAKSPRHSLQSYTLEDISYAGGYARVVYPENSQLIYEQIKGIADGKT